MITKILLVLILLLFTYLSYKVYSIYKLLYKYASEISNKLDANDEEKEDPYLTIAKSIGVILNNRKELDKEIERKEKDIQKLKECLE